MIRCPSCSSETAEGSRFCPSCGGSLGLDTKTPTEMMAPGGGAPAEKFPTSSSWSSSAASSEGRFPAGTLLADRYRIIGRLGRGGMGEVYRADDLKLGQPVALKFLPQHVATSESMLARFHHEVKIARQVSHPNVCRVYDIGEVDGQHYISMEAVDGEDLRSLLKRIGRVPGDKAVQIARQLCAGLAAAHDKGVLHRDLKPSNVMIDGEGRVRVTDFGLAGIAGQIRGAEVRSGTPMYMAPEQLAGKEVSVASDIYALGLVLFEMFTGRPAYKASSLAELLKMQQDGDLTSPSNLVQNLDPAVERVILRCLSKRPAERPSSALAVAAALPGGDPVAAALAAGETPSPEMVAAAGEDLGVRPMAAVGLFAVFLIALVAAVILSAHTQLTNQIPLPKRPEVLAQEARDILSRLGHTAEPSDSAHGFIVDEAYLDHMEETDDSSDRWDGLATDRPGALQFWYRQSPRPLEPVSKLWSLVSPTDPPLDLSGMASVRLTPEGLLLGLELVPPQRDEGTGDAPEPDWGALLSMAGLDIGNLESAEPIWTPSVYADRRAAWTGAHAGEGRTPLRVEAGSYRGKGTFFEVIAPWTKPTRMEEEEISTGQKIAQSIGVAIFLLVPLVGGLLLARHNLRAGRGDRKGAFRLATFYLIVHMIVWVFTAKHVPAFAEVTIFIGAVSTSLWQSFMLYVLYVALEPYVRRRWPDALVSWTRVLSGRFRDALVGRDVLVGTLVGAVMTILFSIGTLAPAWLGRPPAQPGWGHLSNFLGVPRLLGNTLDALVHAQVPAMAILFIFLLLRILLRRQLLAGLVLMALMTMVIVLQSDTPWIDGGIAVIGITIALFTLTQFGLLAFTAMFYCLALLDGPLTLNLSAWYAGATIVPALVLIGLAAFGFYTSLAGRSLFVGDLFQE